MAPVSAPCRWPSHVLALATLVLTGGVSSCRSSDSTAAGRSGEPRVICGTLTCAEVALELGATNVIAWTPIALDTKYSLIASRLAGRDVAPPDAEGMAAFRPSIVVTATFSRPETLTQLERLGIPTVTLTSPETWEEIWQTIDVLGGVLERKAEAAQLQTRGKARLAALNGSAPRIDGRKPRVVCWLEGNAPGRKTTVDLALTAAGVENVARGEGWLTMDAERLVTASPDVVVLSDGPGAIERFRENPALARWMDAGGRVALVSGPLLGTTSHQLVDLAETLQERVRKALSSEAGP